MAESQHILLNPFQQVMQIKHRPWCCVMLCEMHM